MEERKSKTETQNTNKEEHKRTHTHTHTQSPKSRPWCKHIYFPNRRHNRVTMGYSTVFK